MLQYATDIDAVVKKVYDALNPFGHTHERTKPESIVLSLLSMALMGQEAGIDHGYIAESLLRVGFTSFRSRTLDTFMGSMDLDIPLFVV